MTTTGEWDYREQAEQWITCPYCQAKPTVMCRTSGGRFTTPHTARTAILLVAWSVGYDTGWTDGNMTGRRQAARS